MTVAAPPLRSTWAFPHGTEVAASRTAQGLLGGGRRYEVYACWNHRRMLPTVVKVPRPEFAGDERARRWLAREGDLLGSLHHPGLPALLDMDPRGSPPYIEMEFAEGGRLSTRIRRSGPLLFHEAVTIGRHVASTLAYLHERGILHLDVKPSNIVVAAPPRLIDFSVARRVDQVDRISSLVGTDAYMAPEQADPERWRSIGPKSDTWGLGVTLHQSLTGRRPYGKGRRDAPGAERFPQLTSPAERLDAGRYPSEVRELIAGCLRPDPDLRPTVADVAERLDRLARTARTA